MKLLKKFYLVLLVFAGPAAFSQNPLYGPTISYQNQSGNMGKIGGFFLMANDTGTFAYKIDASANIAHFRNQTIVIPEAGLTLYPFTNNLALPFFEAEVTPYTLTPKVGISLLTFLEFSLGYGFEIETKQDLKPIKGLTFSVGLCVPINIF